MQYAFQYVRNNRSVKAVGRHGSPTNVVSEGSISISQSNSWDWRNENGYQRNCRRLLSGGIYEQ